MSENWRRRLRGLAELTGLTDLTEAELIEFGRTVAKEANPVPPTANGRAVAAVVFYRTRDYWPEFDDITDEAPLMSWAEIFDSYPLITPDIAEKAVDHVAALGIQHPLPGHFINAAVDVWETYEE